MRQAPRSPLSFKLQRVANVPEHPPPSTRLMSCAHIANRQLSRIIGARSTDTKPDAADGMNERIGLLTVDLSADAPDIHVDDVGRGVEVQIPYMLQQHRSGNNPAVIANEVLENLKFARQQPDLPAPAGRRSRYEVELEVADAQHRFLDNGRTASGERLDPRQ